MSYMKSVPTGASGNTRLLKSYGGGSKGPRQAYASGGAVKGLNADGPALSEGMSASGSPAKPNLARAGRKLSKKGGKKDDKDDGGKKGTTVNVVIASGGKGPDGPPPGPPMGGPPMPPPGPGGPPPMMRASGGSVTNKEYAADKRKEAETHRTMQGLNSLQALTNTAVGAISKGKVKGLNLVGGGLGGVNTAERYRLGREASDEADRAERGLAEDGKEDRRASGGKVCRSVGGPASPPRGFKAGAGGGLGRLAKIKKYGK